MLDLTIRGMEWVQDRRGVKRLRCSLLGLRFTNGPDLFPHLRYVHLDKVNEEYFTDIFDWKGYPNFILDYSPILQMVDVILDPSFR